MALSSGEDVAAVDSSDVEAATDDTVASSSGEDVAAVDSSDVEAATDDTVASSSGEDVAAVDSSDVAAVDDSDRDDENSDAASTSNSDAASTSNSDVATETPGGGSSGPSGSDGPAPPRELRRLAHITDVVIQVLESWPMQVIAQVSGDLPDPCHELWWEVAVNGNTYDVQVWEVSLPPDSGMACAAVIVPFVENVPLGGGFVSDDYTFIVNGEVHQVSL